MPSVATSTGCSLSDSCDARSQEAASENAYLASVSAGAQADGEQCHPASLHQLAVIRQGLPTSKGRGLLDGEVIPLDADSFESLVAAPI